VKKVNNSEGRQNLSVVFVGHVDHGKSSIVGRLLADTKSLPKGKIEQVRQRCAQAGQEFEYAFLIDALKDEQAQNITIDSARVFFQTPLRDYIIIDAPGHVEFIKNMVTGAARAEAALLVVDASEGVRENSRRHAYLLRLLGIRQLVVLVNKMDKVNYSQSRFSEVVEDCEAFFHSIEVEARTFIPVSARKGDNISTVSKHMPWYNGDTVLTVMDLFEKSQPLEDRPFRMPVQDVYKFTGLGDDRRIVAGTPACGSLQVGDRVVFFPSGKASTVRSFEHFPVENIESASARMPVGFTLAEQIYVRRGEIVARGDEPAPRVTKRLLVSLFWLGKEPLIPGKDYILKLGTARVKAGVESIKRVIDSSNYGERKAREMVGYHDAAEVVLQLHQPLAFEMPEMVPELNRFVIVDNFQISGGGIILEDLEDSQLALRERAYLRDKKWVKGEISVVQRAERYNQQPALVLMTGVVGSGRKKLAQMLETHLFNQGRYVYYLGIGSTLYGVSADLKRKQPGDDRQEAVRRLSEVANILLDAGLILIVTAIEFSQEDIEILKTVVDPEWVFCVWVGSEVVTDIRTDLQIQTGEDMEQAILRIEEMLAQRRVDGMI